MSNAPLPLEQELSDALYRDLWTLRQAMDDRPEGDDAGYVPPAHRYLPALKEAVAKWMEANECAIAEIPREQEYKIKRTRWQDMDPVREVAQHAPEVRRYWLLSNVLNLLNRSVEMLENEGRPQPAKLGPRRLPPLNYEDLPS